jgi:hypothetical protein
MSKNVYITHQCEESLTLLKESVEMQNPKKYILSGPFTIFDIVNEKQRFYIAKDFQPHLKRMQESIQKNGCIYGELNHPENFGMKFTNVSHSINKIWMNERDSRVEGEIELLPTPQGKNAMAMVEEGKHLYVSYRAAGVVKSDGLIVINQLLTYDVVAQPVFSQAKMNTLTESLGFNPNGSIQFYEMKN